MNNGIDILFNRVPLVVNVELASLLGLNESMVLQQVHYWLEKNKGQGRNLKDGFVWTYNTYKDWQEQFPFWSDSTIRRTISKLENTGLLVSANYNKEKFDRTKWYRIDYNVLINIVSNRLGQNDQIGNNGVSEASSDEVIINQEETPSNQQSIINNTCKPQNLRVGQNDQIDDVILTNSNRSFCPHPSGQNDPTNTRDYNRDYTEITTTNSEYKTDELFSTKSKENNSVVDVSIFNSTETEQQTERSTPSNKPDPVDVTHIKTIFINQGIQGIPDKTLHEIGSQYSEDELLKIAQMLRRKKEQGYIKNPAGLLAANSRGISDAILRNEFYPDKKSVTANSQKEARPDYTQYEIYVPPVPPAGT